MIPWDNKHKNNTKDGEANQSYHIPIKLPTPSTVPPFLHSHILQRFPKKKNKNEESSHRTDTKKEEMGEKKRRTLYMKVVYPSALLCPTTTRAPK